ncbi:hypothetical protein GALL_459960 [mine drainage metagenome]|uniref:TMEM205-like domain-containing protein n=1 Tax=mine drainage metagenome TaxID=410659 RepID=A0A1J5PXT5_9ZZZZ
MKSFLSAAALWLAAFWWGSLTSVGFGVVPLLFAYLPTPAMAGNMAAKLFAAQTWVAVVCGMFLLLASRSNQPADQVKRVQSALVFIVSGMLLALLSEFAVAPHIIARDNLALWHGVGTALYLLQWLCAGLTLHKLTRRSSGA